jgi:hypothetical protein
MDFGRLRTWEWFTGLAGAVLLLSLFLPWYGAEGFEGTANAWQAFTVVDIVLAAVALLAIAHFVVTAFQRTASVPQTFVALLVWIATAGLIVALFRLASPPEVLTGAETTREIGVWIGAVEVLAVVFGAWRSMRDKSFPAAMRPRLDVETIPTPTADGERLDVQR